MRAAWWHFRRWLKLPAITPVWIISHQWRHFLGALLLPGFGLMAAGYRRTSIYAFGLIGIALLTFIVCFGQPLGWMAASLVIALHSISMGVWLGRIFPHWRLLAGPATLAVLLVLVYWPLEYGLHRLILPLQTVNGLVIVKCHIPAGLKRGDLVAFKIARTGDDRREVQTLAGIGLERILAGPGETVRFSKDTFTVGDETLPRREHMPQSGELVLELDQWFVWPTFAVRSHGMDAATIDAAFLAHSVIPRKALLGVPFERWFWRKSTLP